jgi:hypothetical protein
MLISIDITCYGPQIRNPYIMIVGEGTHGMDAYLYSSPQST